jgi:glutathione peroxidase
MIKSLLKLIKSISCYNNDLTTIDSNNLTSIHHLSFTTIEGENINFSDFKGKILLIVNTASLCGFTSQYKDLEQLYQTYSEQGLVIVGFPSNNFGRQEPKNDNEIKSFCDLNYHITFPLAQKSDVRGENKNPVFKYLTENNGSSLKGSSLKGEVRWNFEKFLINQSGILVARYRSYTNPLSNKIISDIKELLTVSSNT